MNEMFDYWSESRVRRWEETCPHGHIIHHEKDETPGGKSHDRWTDCPICRRDL